MIGAVALGAGLVLVGGILRDVGRFEQRREMQRRLVGLVAAQVAGDPVFSCPCYCDDRKGGTVHRRPMGGAGECSGSLEV